MIEVLGRATSSNVQAVMWAIAEMGVAHSRVDIGGQFGGNTTPDFLAMNPMGRVPVLRDGDLAMFESQAILRYLAARYGADTLWPDDPVARAPVDQWMEWSKGSVAPAVIYKVFWQLVRVSAAERDMGLVEAGVEELKVLMRIADAQIARHGWLAGSQISLADITFGTQLFRYFSLEFDRADLPHLRDYYDRLCTRPAYAEQVMVSYESLRVPGA